MIALRFLAAFVIALTTAPHATIVKAHARILCQLGTTIDSRTARSGDEFVLRVDTTRYPTLLGAVIRGHVTHVHRTGRADVGFLFDSITFQNGQREPIRAYVVAANVVNRRTMPAAHPVPTAPGQASPSTMIFQTQLGPKIGATAQTGGYAYARRSGVPLVMHAGMRLTIQLASALHTP
jgi:hypothetical protein